MEQANTIVRQRGQHIERETNACIDAINMEIQIAAWLKPLLKVLKQQTSHALLGNTRVLGVVVELMVKWLKDHPVEKRRDDAFSGHFPLQVCCNSTHTHATQSLLQTTTLYHPHCICCHPHVLSTEDFGSILESVDTQM